MSRVPLCILSMTQTFWYICMFHTYYVVDVFHPYCAYLDFSSLSPFAAKHEYFLLSLHIYVVLAVPFPCLALQAAVYCNKFTLFYLLTVNR